MTEELAELAATAANSLVSAIGTDLWQGVKSLMAAILARSRHRRRELTVALDGLPQSSAANASELELGFWTEAIGQLLRYDPTAAAQVAALAALRGQATPGTTVQVNSAIGSGSVFAVQHGPQHFRQTLSALEGTESK